MNIRVEKSCGIDVHKAFLSATILAQTGIKDTREFSTSLEGLLDLRNWIVENGCQRVAIESTGIYWIPTYTMLEDKVETIVANPLTATSQKEAINIFERFLFWQQIRLLLENQTSFGFSTREFRLKKDGRRL